MIDLHAHILPGIDDGAQDIQEALELAEMALEGGTEVLVVTPHSNQTGRFENYNTKELHDRYHHFREVLEKEEIPLKILPGMEIFSSDDIASKIKKELIIGLNFSDYYLVEFPFDAEPDVIANNLEEILEAGKIPLMAHPERYFCVQDDPVLTYEWLQMGCRTQLNRGSVFGRFGRYVERAANFMLENGLVTCIASDAHSPYMRTSYMGDIERYLMKYYGHEAAYWLLVGNPEKIICNKRIPTHGGLPERRWFLV